MFWNEYGPWSPTKCAFQHELTLLFALSRVALREEMETEVEVNIEKKISNGSKR